MKKRITALTLSLLLIASLTACGAKEETASKETKKEVEAVTPVTFQPEDIEDVTAGLGDVVVLQNAEGVDFLANITCDDTIVKEISVDSTAVDLSALGEYKAVYQIKVDAQALTDYLNKKMEPKTIRKLSKAKTMYQRFQRKSK